MVSSGSVHFAVMADCSDGLFNGPYETNSITLPDITDRDTHVPEFMMAIEKWYEQTGGGGLGDMVKNESSLKVKGTVEGSDGSPFNKALRTCFS